MPSLAGQRAQKTLEAMQRVFDTAPSSLVAEASVQSEITRIANELASQGDYRGARVMALLARARRLYLENGTVTNVGSSGTSGVDIDATIRRLKAIARQVPSAPPPTTPENYLTTPQRPITPVEPSGVPSIFRPRPLNRLRSAPPLVPQSSPLDRPLSGGGGFFGRVRFSTDLGEGLGMPPEPIPAPSAINPLNPGEVFDAFARQTARENLDALQQRINAARTRARSRLLADMDRLARARYRIETLPQYKINAQGRVPFRSLEALNDAVTASEAVASNLAAQSQNVLQSATPFARRRLAAAVRARAIARLTAPIVDLKSIFGTPQTPISPVSTSEVPSIFRPRPVSYSATPVGRGIGVRVNNQLFFAEQGSHGELLERTVGTRNVYHARLIVDNGRISYDSGIIAGGSLRDITPRANFARTVNIPEVGPVVISAPNMPLLNARARLLTELPPSKLARFVQVIRNALAGDFSPARIGARLFAERLATFVAGRPIEGQRIGLMTRGQFYGTVLGNVLGGAGIASHTYQQAEVAGMLGNYAGAIRRGQFPHVPAPANWLDVVLPEVAANARNLAMEGSIFGTRRSPSIYPALRPFTAEQLAAFRASLDRDDERVVRNLVELWGTNNEDVIVRILDVVHSIRPAQARPIIELIRREQQRRLGIPGVPSFDPIGLGIVSSIDFARTANPNPLLAELRPLSPFILEAARLNNVQYEEARAFFAARYGFLGLLRQEAIFLSNR